MATDAAAVAPRLIGLVHDWLPPGGGWLVLRPGLADILVVADGRPVVTADVIRGHDRMGDLHRKRADAHPVGVRLVWLVDPGERAVQVFPLGGRPSMVKDAEELAGGDALPGFRVPVARLFE